MKDGSWIIWDDPQASCKYILDVITHGEIHLVTMCGETSMCVRVQAALKLVSAQHKHRTLAIF